jgi:hypothetical protein
MSESFPAVRFGLAVSLEELLLLNSLVHESLESPASFGWDDLLTNISSTTKQLISTNPHAVIGLDLTQVQLSELNGLLQGKYPAQDRPLIITHLIDKIENGIVQILKKSLTIDAPDSSPYSELSVHVFANIVDSDNLISVKQFATRTEAKAWMDQQKMERPGYYEIIHESEFDCSA